MSSGRRARGGTRRAFQLISRRPLLAILVLGGVLRLALLASSPHFALFGDALDYQRHGVSIGAGYGFPPTELASAGSPSAFRAPAYPYLLGGTYALFGHSIETARILAIVLGELVIALLYLAGAMIWNRRVGLAAALIGACYLPFIGLSTSVLSETLFLPIELGVCVAVSVAFTNPGRLRWWLLVGCMCGLAALTRPVAEAWVLVTIAIAVSRPGSPLRRTASALAVLLAFAVTITPWTIRNIDSLRAAVPISTEGGLTLAGQYNDQAGANDSLQAVWRSPFAVRSLAPALEPLYERSSGFTEPELDTALRDAALSYVGAHPTHILTAVWWDSLRMFDLGRSHGFVSTTAYQGLGTPASLRRLTTLSAQILALVALAALVAAATHRLRIELSRWWLWALALATYIATVPIVGTPVKRLPLDPFLVLLVAAALTALRDRLGPRARQAESGAPPLRGSGPDPDGPP